MENHKKTIAWTKVVTKIGESSVIFEGEYSTEHYLEWTFKFPPGTRINCDINKENGRIFFSVD
jgi:hypothetical protein